MTNNSDHNALKQRIAHLERQIQDRENEIKILKQRKDPQHNHSVLPREERFREIIEDVAEISIQGYDEQRRVTFWNRASEKIYGYTEQEAVGQRLEDLIIPEEMRDAVIALVNQWIDDGIKIPADELLLKHKTGREVPVFSSHVMLETELGKEMFCIDVDLSPVKEAEREKSALREKLLQARKMEALGTLASGVAHDFNNILFSISGLAEMLTYDQDEDGPELEIAEGIMAAVKRGSGIVDQIHSFCRKSENQRQPVFFLISSRKLPIC